MSLNLVASSNKVGSDHLKSLSLIKSNLDSSISFTMSQEVIVLDIGRDDMLHIGNLLHSGVVAISGETCQIDVDNLLAVSCLVIVTSRIVA